MVSNFIQNNKIHHTGEKGMQQILQREGKYDEIVSITVHAQTNLLDRKRIRLESSTIHYFDARNPGLSVLRKNRKIQ